MTFDLEALVIGRLYQQAQADDNRVFHLREVGERLLKKKESLSHGEWLPWVRSNRSMLGFGVRGMRALIEGAQWMAANWQLANELEEIVTNPQATEQELVKADEIRTLISYQFYRPSYRSGTLNRRSNEWYTPAEYIAMARNVLGDIDVDPASIDLAQKTVKARQYFDQHQNGLQQPWHGRVWLNPPYSQSLVAKFVLKLLMEWNAKRITECIALTHNCTDAAWFHDAVSAADAICFTHGRIRFYEPDHNEENVILRRRPTHGQAFFYFGSKVDDFKHEFGRVGFIVRPEPDQWTRVRVRDEASI